ncbi:hypothetical protein OG308_18900 [Nocardia salmonicida]|uniref:Uncharacterized protein n=1 Tax=Nocardia salmonicida TaxID=53431 RepID=A0ABZ1N0H9_9NOCA|nr:hypothetical protein [Nocardia salmonicida]
MGITMFRRERTSGAEKETGRSGREPETAGAIDTPAHGAVGRIRAAIGMFRISLWRLLFHGRLLLSMLLVGSSPDANHLREIMVTYRVRNVG